MTDKKTKNLTDKLPVIDRLNARNKYYEDETNSILQSLAHTVLAGIADFMIHETDVTNDQTFVWTDLDLFEDFCVIIGSVQFKLGTKFKVEGGETFTITEENMHRMQNVLKVNIPMNLLDGGTREEVFDFMNKVHTPHSQAPSNQSNGMGFDLDQLTEEQRNSLTAAKVSKTKLN